MLVLSRREDERVMIGDDVVVTVVRTANDKVRLGISAPPNVGVHREEVFRQIKKAENGNGPCSGSEPG